MNSTFITLSSAPDDVKGSNQGRLTTSDNEVLVRFGDVIADNGGSHVNGLCTVCSG
jgi:hypothetical protein